MCCRQSTETPRRSPMPRAAAQQRGRPTRDGRRRRRGARRGWRATSPGTTLSAPEPPRRLPRWRPARRWRGRAVRPRKSSRAAAASASRRRCIGVVPAWLAWPRKVTARRLWPAMASRRRAADRGIPAPAPARCGTPGSRTFRGSSLASASCAGSSPKARMACSHGNAGGIAPARAVPSSSVPTSARLPINGTPKRTPSSSENADHLDREGQAAAARARPPSAMPSTTPRTPSKAPALGTVSSASRCSRRGAGAVAAG